MLTIIIDMLHVYMGVFQKPFDQTIVKSRWQRFLGKWVLPCLFRRAAVTSAVMTFAAVTFADMTTALIAQKLLSSNPAAVTSAAMTS